MDCYNNIDKSAFERFYLRYKDRVYALALKTLQNKYDAEDAAQQTFLRAYEHMNNNDTAPVTWLEKTALIECELIMRRIRRHEADDTSDCLPVYLSDGEPMLSRSYLDDTIMYSAVKEIINGLAVVQRQTLVLLHYSRMSTSEAAQVMDCSESTVSQRLQCAHQSIKTETDEYEINSKCSFSAEKLPLSSVFIKIIQDDSLTQIASEQIWNNICRIIS